MDYSSQYNTTSYGGQGSQGGGGFTVGESSSQSAGKNRYSEQTLRPVTIKQLNDATQPYPEANFKIDGADITQICLVGQVRNISKLATFSTYRLDDGTGEVDIKYFLDQDEKDDFEGFDPTDVMDTGAGDGAADAPIKAPKRQQITANGYAKAWGVMKSFNDRRSINVHVIRPLTDMNEYYFHFLQATAVHLFFTKGPPPKEGEKGQANAAGATTGADAGTGPADGRALPPMSKMARQVYDILSNTPQTNEGLHMNNLASSMHLPLNEVCTAADELLSHGLIYQTVDEYTWKIL